ncbi:MAG TPA: hypothetical protein H9687_08125 [Firmicutes bacterium]|nr:hypothetical protein [Bacillota bacterium]
MINFKEEIKKYGKILEVDELEDTIHASDMKDIMDMLAYLCKTKQTEHRRSDR